MMLWMTSDKANARIIPMEQEMLVEPEVEKENSTSGRNVILTMVVAEEELHTPLEEPRKKLNLHQDLMEISKEISKEIVAVSEKRHSTNNR